MNELPHTGVIRNTINNDFSRAMTGIMVFGSVPLQEQYPNLGINLLFSFTT